MNRFERAIAAVAPRYAAKRAYARTQINTFARIEQRAAQKRLREDPNFGVNTGNPDDARPRRFIDRQTLLRLAYENPYGRKAINTLVNNSIGWGITGAPKGPKALSTLWLEWIKVADYRGRLDFFGLQELAVRTMFREGESFIVRRWVRDAPVLPFRLQVLDAGMLAIDKVGEYIEDGIEYDADGNVVAHAQGADMAFLDLGHDVGNVGRRRKADAGKALTILDTDAAGHDRADDARQPIAAVAVEDTGAGIEPVEPNGARLHAQFLDIIAAIVPVEAEPGRTDRPTDFDGVVFLPIRRWPHVGGARHHGRGDGARLRRRSWCVHQLVPVVDCEDAAAWAAVNGSPL